MTRSSRRKNKNPQQSMRVGANEDGFVSPDQVHLVVAFNGDSAQLMGPGTHDMEWVIHALSGLAQQWVHQSRMPKVSQPEPGTAPDKWMDCTASDCTVVFYRECHVISMPGEIFDDGLAEYTLDIVGQRRHDDEYCTDRLHALAAAIADDIEAGRVPRRGCGE